jgi:hypothetical protein
VLGDLLCQEIICAHGEIDGFVHRRNLLDGRRIQRQDRYFDSRAVHRCQASIMKFE